MLYHRVTFTLGRTGDGYLEIDDSRMVASRLLSPLGDPVTEPILEYHVVDTSPLHLLWMIVGYVL